MKAVIHSRYGNPEALKVLADILAQPGVTPAVDCSLPLEEAADAMRTLVSGPVHGSDRRGFAAARSGGRVSLQARV